MKTWFTSDTHFGHRNILQYSKRPFATIEEHDEMLIKNWNDCVQPGDDVYFLGDFALCKPEKAKKIRERLVGNIHYIEGNHDKSAFAIRGTFVWYEPVKMVTVEGQDLWLSHYAHRVWPRSHHGVYHLYAHSHGSLPDDPNALSFDVGVDCHNYRPISFAEVKAIMAKKSFVPIDHHGRLELNPTSESAGHDAPGLEPINKPAV